MRQTIFIFSALAITIFLAFELSKYSMFGPLGHKELIIALSAVALIVVGIALQRFLWRPRLAAHTEIDPVEAMQRSGLSKQEYTVLTLLAEGLSNAEIGRRLFIQESTVKSHVSNILLKLGAKRRTEAVKIGRDLDIV